MAEDWLPHEPPPVEETPKKTSAWRTLLIWAVLIVIFIVLYNWFGTVDKKGKLVEHVGYSGWWIALAAVIGLAIPISWVVWQLGKGGAFVAAQADGLTALAEGKPARAAELFAELAKKFRHRPAHLAVARYNHGYALLRAGDSEAAVGVLLGGDRGSATTINGSVRILSAIQLARAFAIGGDVAKANAWLATAQTRRAQQDDPVYKKAILASLEALVRCREGKYDEALAVLETNWHLMETYLPIDLMREPWLVRAFATTMRSSVRDASAAEPWLRVLRISSPERVRWLTVHWPELATFATTHDVLRSAAPTVASSTTA